MAAEFKAAASAMLDAALAVAAELKAAAAALLDAVLTMGQGLFGQAVKGNSRIVLTQFWVHVVAAWGVGTGVGYWLADRPRIVQLSGVWIACAVTFAAFRVASGALQRKAPSHGR